MAYTEHPVAMCDAPDCAKAEIVINDVLPPTWIEGTVRNDNDEPVEWVACRDSHIKAAVLDRIQRPSDHNDTTNTVTTEPTTADSTTTKDPA